MVLQVYRLIVLLWKLSFQGSVLQYIYITIRRILYYYYIQYYNIIIKIYRYVDVAHDNFYSSTRLMWPSLPSRSDTPALESCVYFILL